MLTKNQTLFAVFLLCIITRLLSSIFYIEDIDSLRFALSIYEYDITKLQPHFPGYPVFCFFAKILYLIMPSMGISFSIIGAISTFVIIYFSLRLGNTEIKSPEGAFMSIIIFFNPMIWLMGNRYMPDLMGLALASAILYFFICLFCIYSPMPSGGARFCIHFNTESRLPSSLGAPILYSFEYRIKAPVQPGGPDSVFI